MAGYRPIGLSSAAGSTIIAGRPTSYADRRRAAAERLSKTADIARRLEESVTVPGTDVAVAQEPIDPHGTLRAAIRALLPLAYRTDGFEVTISLGPSHEWAASVTNGPDGVSAELVPGPGRARSGDGRSSAPSESETAIAAELASLLWSGGVGAR